MSADGTQVYQNTSRQQPASLHERRGDSEPAPGNAEPQSAEPLGKEEQPEFTHKRTASRPRPSRSNSTGIALEDVVLDRIDAFLETAQATIDSWEARLGSWEEYSAAVLDEKAIQARQRLEDFKKEVLDSGRRRADAFLKVLDKYHVGEAGSPVADKVSAGVEYFEGLLRAAEEFRAQYSVQRALAAARSRLLKFEELPLAWQHNPYITRGYRFCKDPAECLKSMVHIHNETCNIWTHLGGFFVLVGLALFHMPKTAAWQDASWVDRLPMLVFIAAAMKCLVCSAVWHSFCNISQIDLKKRFACVDYMGITVLITASVLTTEYVVLYCHEWLRSFYMFVTFASGVGGVLFTWSPRFDDDAYKGQRLAFFIGLAAAGALAGIHASFFMPVSDVLHAYMPVVKSLLSYIIGVVFYASNFPERALPGTIFDYFGMSHNLWHLAVCGGIYYHYEAMLSSYETSRTMVCGL